MKHTELSNRVEYYLTVNYDSEGLRYTEARKQTY